MGQKAWEELLSGLRNESQIDFAGQPLYALKALSVRFPVEHQLDFKPLTKARKGTQKMQPAEALEAASLGYLAVIARETTGCLDRLRSIEEMAGRSRDKAVDTVELTNAALHEMLGTTGEKADLNIVREVARRLSVPAFADLDPSTGEVEEEGLKFSDQLRQLVLHVEFLRLECYSHAVAFGSGSRLLAPNQSELMRKHLGSLKAALARKSEKHGKLSVDDWTQARCSIELKYSSILSSHEPKFLSGGRNNAAGGANSPSGKDSSRKGKGTRPTRGGPPGRGKGRDLGGPSSQPSKWLDGNAEKVSWPFRKAPSEGVCFDFATTGECSRGSACTYQHGPCAKHGCELQHLLSEWCFRFGDGVGLCAEW